MIRITFAILAILLTPYLGSAQIISGYYGPDNTVAGPVFLDTFTGADGTALADHTPDVGGAWTTNTNHLTISGNKVACALGDAGGEWHRGTISIASADFSATVDVVFGNFNEAGQSWGGILGNQSAYQTAWVYNIVGDDTVKIMSCESGSCTTRASSTSTIEKNTTYGITATKSGQTRTLTIGPVVVTSAAYSFNDTTANAGIATGSYIGWLETGFDNFTVWP